MSNKILLNSLFFLSISFIISNCANQNFINGADTITTKSKILNKYKLVWADEFSIEGKPDSTKWTYDIGTGTWGWGNDEKEYYTNRINNANIKKGRLNINAIKENYNGSAYTSARIVTKNKFDFTYGKIEVRAKLPAGVGTWPAIWMLGSNIDKEGWPVCGEIDIMEHKGCQLNKIYSTLHYPNRYGNNADGDSIIIKNANTSFHIYSTIWTASTIQFFVDDKQIKSYVNNEKSPFHKNFHLILNVAMGGNFAGPLDSTITNATMEVDYVRVYQ